MGRMETDPDAIMQEGGQIGGAEEEDRVAVRPPEHEDSSGQGDDKAEKQYERPSLEWMESPEASPAGTPPPPDALEGVGAGQEGGGQQQTDPEVVRVFNDVHTMESRANIKAGAKVPRLNLNPDHLSSHGATLGSTKDRGNVSFSSRLPTEKERWMDDEAAIRAPGALGKLLEVNRSRGFMTERVHYRSFEKYVASVPRHSSIRLMAYFDESIMPRYAKGVTPRGEQFVHGTSPLELIFQFFAGRQQPGTAGLSVDTKFDEISAANVAMSFPEMLRCTQIMFRPCTFALKDIKWVMHRAKSDPYSAEEGNWHGDMSSEQNSLNFVEWLSCVVRLSLIGFGAKMSPEQCIDEVADRMQLHDVAETKRRIRRIARSAPGFGGWVDNLTPREELQPLGINLKRPRPIDDYMLPGPAMLKLQHRLLAQSRTKQNTTWSAFAGPYISMVVPATAPGQKHRFQIIVQNTSHSVFNIAFKVEGLPFMSASHLPARSFCASGLDCVCDLTAVLPEVGEFSGDVLVTNPAGDVVYGKCPVYLRVIHGGGTRYLVSRGGGQAEGNPIHKVLTQGSLLHRLHTDRGSTDELLRRGMTSPRGKDTYASEEKRLTKSAAGLIMPLKVTNAYFHTGALPLHPRSRRVGKPTSSLNSRGFTPLSKEPIGTSYTPRNGSFKVVSPANFARTSSSALSGPLNWLDGITLKSEVGNRLAL